MSKTAHQIDAAARNVRRLMPIGIWRGVHALQGKTSDDGITDAAISAMRDAGEIEIAQPGAPLAGTPGIVGDGEASALPMMRRVAAPGDDYAALRETVRCPRCAAAPGISCASGAGALSAEGVHGERSHAWRAVANQIDYGADHP